MTTSSEVEGDSIQINLGDIDDQGVTIYGAAAGDRSGRSVSDAGDVNGDGFDDLLIGAELADGAGNATEDAGTSYLLFGSADFANQTSIDLANLDDAGLAIHGTDPFDFSGKAVGSAGDVNGDGFDDFLIGAGSADGIDNLLLSSGETYLIFGSADLSAESQINLASLGSRGVTLLGGDSFDNSGWLSIGTAGDVNGDGLDDIVLGAPYADSEANLTPASGEAHLIFGRTEWPEVINLDEHDEMVTFDGVGILDKTGWAVSAAGDINGDGIDDVAIGAPNASPIDSVIRGVAYVVYGKTDWSDSRRVRLAELGSEGLTIFGDDAFDDHGAAISKAGDVNGDGLDDLIIGAYSADSIDNSRRIGGESYLILGRTSWPADGIVDLQLTHSMITTIYGDQSSTRSGRSVSGAGDVNGDGFADLLIGSENSHTPNESPLRSGKSFVLFGGDAWPYASIDLAANEIPGLVVSGVNPSDLSGRYVSRAGDVDGDGFDDIVIGAFFADGPDNSRPTAGDSYVIMGGDFTSSATSIGTPNGESLVGDSAIDVIVAGQGNDYLSGGGGQDVLRGGEGDDTIAIHDASFRSVSGGNGTDTLRIEFPVADMTEWSYNRVAGIERIALTSPLANTLRIDFNAAIQLSDESNDIVIDAGYEDTVELGPGWSLVADANDTYVTYIQGVARILLTPKIGDSNRDGVFNSSDLIRVLQAGEYEDGVENNSTFAEGDWNGDGEFDSSDFLLAFQLGNYSQAARRVSAEPLKTSAVAAAIHSPRIAIQEHDDSEPEVKSQHSLTPIGIDKYFFEWDEPPIVDRLF